MDQLDTLTRLHRHQRLALDIIRRSAEAIAAGPDMYLVEMKGIRHDTTTVLRDYQAFKHGSIFDPAIASHDPVRAAAAREMKARCIRAGETLGAHLRQWAGRDIRAEWDDYRNAARLTINELRRHIDLEAKDISSLMAATGTSARAA